MFIALLLPTGKETILVFFAISVQLCAVGRFFLFVILNERGNPFTQCTTGFRFYLTLAESSKTKKKHIPSSSWMEFILPLVNLFHALRARNFNKLSLTGK